MTPVRAALLSAVAVLRNGLRPVVRLVRTAGRAGAARTAGLIGPRLPSLPPLRWLVPGVVALVVLLVFPVAMVVISRIDDAPDFAPSQPALGRSHAVAVVAALITRELDVNKWRANDPFFLPGGWLRDMPAFQLGLVGGLARVTGALAAENGAGWAAGGPDVTLNHAAGLLKYPGTVWKFDTRKSWLPTASAEKQYRNAQRSLDIYNDQVAAGTVGFARTPEALALVVAGLIADLDDTAGAIDRHLAEDRPALLDFSVNGVFYRNKGRLYAHAIVMRELGRDFETLLGERRLAATWTAMVGHLAAAARPRPTMVWSAAPESSLLPNHLLAQGYPALQARRLAADILAELRRP